ncbi:hypothetical protein EFK50_19155 [Nocardioides marmoriginsengisoli]|uniref:Lipoprotein n=1 Tax=Nocardioides marmoriginsengisoli TaxID=661483 RepID=A0A3N0CAG2_9ACTN|nr:hypothetical protein [Nocardioides marmoriginsengisoli]RNL60447.1 hypothetical protein EFK50_19155 [Nocardioides marmoriginsengisoli]
MKNLLGVSVLAASLFLGACGSDDPAAEPDPGSTTAPTTPASTGPSSGPSTGSSTDPAPSDGASPTGDGDLDCLIAGSPWRVSTTDLASQFAGVMRGINVTSTRIAGNQTLTVGADLRATFADNTTTTVKVAMGNGLTMVMVQKHRGQSSGRLRASTGKLVGYGWTGRIRGNTKVTINGRAAEAPFSMPAGSIGDHPMTYDCSGATMNLSVEGSPFQYLFKSS